MVAGIKINELNLLDSRGYSRSRISSRAIEAYLIQVRNSCLNDSFNYLFLILNMVARNLRGNVCKFFHQPLFTRLSFEEAILS